MISFDFDYFRPSTWQEAVNLFLYLEQQGKQPMYLNGGTEIITTGRFNLFYTDAVIDIKGIHECRVLTGKNDNVVMGAGISLTALENANVYPLLSATSRQIADHTARSKITLGGNVCGRIFYREAVLPFLLADSRVVIAGPEGIHEFSIHQRFQKQIILSNGEFVVQLITKQKYMQTPFFHIKRRKQWDMGYPLITVAAVIVDQQVRVAISGLCPFPFRSEVIENFLNDDQLSLDEKVNHAIQHIPDPILDDVEGSAEYRLFVLRNTLIDALVELKGARRE